MKTFYLEKSLGIDIREESVCLTLLGKNLYRADVIAVKYIPIHLADIKNEKTEINFLEQVNRFIVENDAWVENVVASLPRSKVTLQSFELPAPDRKSVDSMMKFELERHFSSDIESFYFSNHITDRGTNQYHIVCAAIRKNIADRYLKLLEKLNLKTTILDVSTFANLNLIWPNEEYNESLSVVVDLSLSFIEISILNNRILEFSRNIPIDNPEYREAFFNSEIQQKAIEDSSEKITQTIVDEIQNALASCRNIDDSVSVEAIHILGGGNFATPLTSKLETTTEVPTHRVELPEFLNSPVPDNYSTAYMATSLGLALRELKQNSVEISLLPENSKITQRKKINTKTTVALMVATVLFFIGFIANQHIHNNKVLASLDKQLEELRIEMGPLEKVDLEYEALQKYMKVLDRIHEIHPTKLPMLIELSRIIPKDTWLKKIQFKKGEMEIKGISGSASRLLPIVENSNFFSDTRFMGTIITDSGGEKFTISSAIGITQ